MGLSIETKTCDVAKIGVAKRGLSSASPPWFPSGMDTPPGLRRPRFYHRHHGKKTCVAKIGVAKRRLSNSSPAWFPSGRDTPLCLRRPRFYHRHYGKM